MSAGRRSGAWGRRIAAALAAAAAAAGWAAGAQVAPPKLGYSDTPFLPGGKWRVHDGTRPQPRVVDPGTGSTPESPGRPPSDALVLFDGTGLSEWRTASGGPAGWKVENGCMEIPAPGQPGRGPIRTVREFGDCQLHVEFTTPSPARGDGQSRGNSGIFFLPHYEIQVLDSYGNQTYPDGQAAALYAQYPPLVNASRKPGEWQAYDILWTMPRFEGERLVTPAYVTLLHNGVAVHNRTEVLGRMFHRQAPRYVPHPPKLPIGLQDHGSPVRFRNLWVRELKGYDEP